MRFLLSISLKSLLIHKQFGISRIVKNYSSLRTFSYKSISSLVNEKSEQDQIKTSENENSDQDTKDTFKEIYRFSYIPFGHMINKCKWPQTLLVAFVFPNSVAMYFGGIIDFDMLLGIIGAGGFVTANLYAYGSFFDNAVGFLYLNEEGTTLKISYLSFWGDRVNKEVAVDDIMPLADCPKIPMDFIYRTIYFYSAEKFKLKLYLKTGGKITDPHKFVRVFGDDLNFE